MSCSLFNEQEVLYSELDIAIDTGSVALCAGQNRWDTSQPMLQARADSCGLELLQK